MSKDDAGMHLRKAMRTELPIVRSAIAAKDFGGAEAALQALEKRLKRVKREIEDIEED